LNLSIITEAILYDTLKGVARKAHAKRIAQRMADTKTAKPTRPGQFCR
jgi:hypothetical protein